MSKEKVLVIGASGTVGSSLVQELQNKDVEVVQAPSRKPTSSHQVQLNLVTGEGVKQAFEGIDKAYLLSPPGVADQYSVLSPLIQEAKRRGLKKVVLMTAMGADADPESPFRRAEVELEQSGLTYNIIRPNWFYQNFNTFWVQGIVEQNKILLPAGNVKVSFIDARDIAAVAATLLTTDEFDNQAFNLSGLDAVDHSEVAQAISNVVSREVTYEEIEPEVLKAGLLGAGLPEDYVDFMLLIFGFLREGYNAGLTDEVEKILGRKPRGLNQYTEDFKKAW
ncbi:MAG: nucleoside-diphosphate sugar epimerase [Bdellovibrionaceae bacterium]|nr:nucleoside-diphosphate sugar epimerase [Pseudobdellovibrionaceae bacterium]